VRVTLQFARSAAQVVDFSVRDGLVPHGAVK